MLLIILFAFALPILVMGWGDFRDSDNIGFSILFLFLGGILGSLFSFLLSLGCDSETYIQKINVESTPTTSVKILPLVTKIDNTDKYIDTVSDPKYVQVNYSENNEDIKIDFLERSKVKFNYISSCEDPKLEIFTDTLHLREPKGLSFKNLLGLPFYESMNPETKIENHYTITLNK